MPLPALVCLPAEHSSARAAAPSQTALKFSLLVSCVPSPALQLDALGCYIRENSAKLAFLEVQNNVSERMVAFKGKNRTSRAARHDRTWFQFSCLHDVNFHFPRSRKITQYCLSTRHYVDVSPPEDPVSTSELSLFQNCEKSRSRGSIGKKATPCCSCCADVPGQPCRCLEI